MALNRPKKNASMTPIQLTVSALFLALGPCIALASENGELPPQIVRFESVRNADGIKFVVLGNKDGRFNVSCNLAAEGCITPARGRDYYVFEESTRWTIPGAKNPITLSFIQNRTVTYPDIENIGILAKNSDTSPAMGLFILNYWTAMRHD